MRTKNDELGTFGTIVFFIGLALIFWATIPALFWLVVWIVSVCGVLAGINWLFTRFR